MTSSNEGGMRALHKYARLSLLSVVLTAIPITVNHFFSLGPGALAMGAFLVVSSVGLLLGFRKTKSRWIFYAYVLVNAWIIVGFGLYAGLWKTILRLTLGVSLASSSTAFPKPPVGGILVEASGVLMFVGAGFVAYAIYRFIRARSMMPASASSTPARQPPLLAVIVGALVLLAATGGAYALAARDRWEPPTDGVVKIAVIAPTGGPYELLVRSFVSAVELAKDDLTKDTKYRYKLVIVDSGPDPAAARPIIQRTLARGDVDAILGAISLIGAVTQPLALEAKVPHLCVCTVASIGDGAYSFTNIPLPEAEAILWAKEARARSITSVSILAQDYPSIRGHVNAMKTEAARAGIRVSSERYFAADTTDFRELIAGAKAAGPDTIYVEAFNPALDTLAAQLRDAGAGNLSSVVGPSLSDRPELFEGAWYTDSNLADAGFVERLMAKYPDARFAAHMMPYAYDNFAMIVDAFENQENPAVHLRKLTSYDGTAGLLTKERGAGNFCSTPAVWEIRNATPTLVGQRDLPEALDVCRDAASHAQPAGGFVH